MGGACVGWGLCVELVWGLCVWGLDGVCVGGACVGGVKKKFQFIFFFFNQFINFLSFIIPVNKMNLKSLPLLNHIHYKSKELYLLHQQF